jgi:hypothetical protein
MRDENAYLFLFGFPFKINFVFGCFMIGEFNLFQSYSKYSRKNKDVNKLGEFTKSSSNRVKEIETGYHLQNQKGEKE